MHVHDMFIIAYLIFILGGKKIVYTQGFKVYLFIW